MSLENQPPSAGGATELGGPDCGEDVKKALAAVEEATAEVREATAKLEGAEAKLTKAEAALKEALEHPRHFKVEVIYNGVEHSVAAEASELVKALLERAIQSFGSLPNPHTLALFTKAGQELPDNVTVKDAGVKPCETLLLRPSTVKGGAA